jgi:hypothetical protein
MARLVWGGTRRRLHIVRLGQLILKKGSGGIGMAGQQRSVRQSNRACATAARALSEPLEPRRLLSAGDLDPSFGDGGAIFPAFPTLATGAEAGAVALAGGKLVVAGGVTGTWGGAKQGFGAGVARYNADTRSYV